MKALHLLAAVYLVAASASTWADNPFAAFKGKVKEGLYDYKIEMDMGQIPGMGAGMGKRNMSFQHCLTSEELETGYMGRSGPNSQKQGQCDTRNFKMSGNSASYTMVCKGEGAMTADNNITFTSDGYKMDIKMVMNQGAQSMNMSQHIESRYLGPCK